MIASFRYASSSGIADTADGRQVHLAANLSREPVAFNAPLLQPLRFREAICALHDCVISDLRYQPRDKTAYEAWKKQQVQVDQQIRRDAYQSASQALLLQQQQPLPADFQAQHESARRTYWKARQHYSDWLYKNDPAVWRTLMPCDPVVTVADDVVFFECFSADESSYGCLSVDREGAFGSAGEVKLGTTNVDYSWKLFEQFQSLRSYRPARLAVDPEGFEIRHRGQEAYREEKIDLPGGWLRGFTTLQAAMTMTGIKVTLPREAVYSLLAFIKRNKARRSPRALRFELNPGRPVRLVLEPWEQSFNSSGSVYDGPPTPPIRVWGTRRLVMLGRLLPLIESVEVHLIDTGLPSFWVANMGPMRLTLGLSGWTTNDWTRGSALDLLAAPAAPTPGHLQQVQAALQASRVATLADLTRQTGDERLTRAVVRRLAQTGQAIFDLHAQRYRWRQIMPMALGEAEMGPENEEVREARKLVDANRASLIDRQDGPGGLRVIQGKVESKPVEILIDADESIKRGKCLCGHFRQYGLRNGPCRHMIALRWVTTARAFTARGASAT